MTPANPQTLIVDVTHTMRPTWDAFGVLLRDAEAEDEAETQAKEDRDRAREELLNLSGSEGGASPRGAAASPEWRWGLPPADQKKRIQLAQMSRGPSYANKTPLSGKGGGAGGAGGGVWGGGKAAATSEYGGYTPLSFRPEDLYEVLESTKASHTGRSDGGGFTGFGRLFGEGGDGESGHGGDGGAMEDEEEEDIRSRLERAHQARRHREHDSISARAERAAAAAEAIGATPPPLTDRAAAKLDYSSGGRVRVRRPLVQDKSREMAAKARAEALLSLAYGKAYDILLQDKKPDKPRVTRAYELLLAKRSAYVPNHRLVQYFLADEAGRKALEPKVKPSPGEVTREGREAMHTPHRIGRPDKVVATRQGIYDLLQREAVLAHPEILIKAPAASAAGHRPASAMAPVTTKAPINPRARRPKTAGPSYHPSEAHAPEGPTGESSSGNEYADATMFKEREEDPFEDTWGKSKKDGPDWMADGITEDVDHYAGIPFSARKKVAFQGQRK